MGASTSKRNKVSLVAFGPDVNGNDSVNARNAVTATRNTTTRFKMTASRTTAVSINAARISTGKMNPPTLRETSRLLPVAVPKMSGNEASQGGRIRSKEGEFGFFVRGII